MNLGQFIASRKPRWARLTELLDRVDRDGLASLPADLADELFSLYRLASSDLNLMQTRTGNPAMLEYLEGLVGRAYASLCVPRRSRWLATWWQIVRHRFPATIRREWRAVLLATLVTLAGSVFGAVATMLDARHAEVFLDAFPAHLAQSPAERVAELEQREREHKPRIASAGDNALFATFLFTHNIRVMVLGFALGLTLGIGTIAVLFYNGAMLGALAAMYFQEGVGTFFVAWVGPHGSIELPCIIFGCAAGLMLARAQFRRDPGTTLAQIRSLRPALVDLLIGTASLLVIAGLIEGGFSQINEPTLPYPLKIAVAAGLFTLLVVYLFVIPVRPDSPDTAPPLSAGVDAAV